MKKLFITLLLTVAAFFSFSQNASYTNLDVRNRLKVTNWIIYKGDTLAIVAVLPGTGVDSLIVTQGAGIDTLIIGGANHWTLTGNNIVNNNTGNVTVGTPFHIDDTTYFKFNSANIPILAAGSDWVLATEKGTGKLVRVSNMDIYEAMLDSAKTNPLPQSIWDRDTITEEVTLAHPSDDVIVNDTFSAGTYLNLPTSIVHSDTAEYARDADKLDGQHGSYYQPLLTNPVTGTGTDNYIPRWNGTSAIENSVMYDDGTNIGIGQTAPSSKLDITTAGLAVTQTTSSGLALVNTTAATALAPVQISPAIRWSGFGWKTDVTAGSQAVDFRSYVVPVQGTANPTGYLSFGSSVNGGAYSDGQMVITTAGNVGIGTTAPGDKLHVSSGVQGDGLLIGAIGEVAPGIKLYTGTANAGARNWGISASFDTFGDFTIRKSTAKDGNPLTAGTTRFTILDGGNIGIRKTNPTSALDLPAGGAAAGSSPLGFTSAPLLSVPVIGKVEFLTDAWYGTITTGTARKRFAFNTDPDTLTVNRPLVMVTNLPAIGAGLTVRNIASQSIIQFGNNLFTGYTGSVDTTKAGVMIRLDTRNGTGSTTYGNSAYTLFQIQTREANSANDTHTIPFQLRAAPTGSFIMDSTGNIGFGGMPGIAKLYINGHLGVGTTVPVRGVDINEASGNCLRLVYNDPDVTPSYYADFLVSSAGNLTIAPSNGDVYIQGMIKTLTSTIPDWDETPDVSGAETFIYNGTAHSDTITDLMNPVVGAYYTLIGNSDTYKVRIVDGGNFKLNATVELGIDDAIRFYCKADNYYIEISRSDN